MFTTGAPDISDLNSGALERSPAGARILAGFPEPQGSVMYLVCNRRRQIWKLRPSGSTFIVEASRGPLFPNHPTLGASTMGDIGGDENGAWYVEHFNGQTVTTPGGPPLATIPYKTPTGQPGLTFQSPTYIHRLDANLNLAASYVFFLVLRNSVGGHVTQPSVWLPAPSFGTGAPGAIGGGGNIVIPASRRPVFNSPSQTWIQGGLVEFSINQIAAQAAVGNLNGTTQAYMLEQAFPWDGQAVGLFRVENDPIPLPGYANMLDPNNPLVTSCDGSGGNMYACHLGGTDYMARWDGGNLVAYKTPADATPQDQYKAQCIGGSSGTCYTTENNNEIVLRDGALNLVRRFQRAELETILGPVNPANGVSNFVFTGIGGR